MYKLCTKTVPKVAIINLHDKASFLSQDSYNALHFHLWQYSNWTWGIYFMKTSNKLPYFSGIFCEPGVFVYIVYCPLQFRYAADGISKTVLGYNRTFLVFLTFFEKLVVGLYSSMGLYSVKYGKFSKNFLMILHTKNVRRSQKFHL